MTTYRPYRHDDLASIVDVWNASMPADPVTLDWFTDFVLLDPNFDPGGLIVACSATNDVVGCIHAARRLTPIFGTDLEPDTGWIPLFFVSPGERGHGIGSALIDSGLDFLARRRVDFGCYTPNYFLPGIDPDVYPDGLRLLRNKGFVVRSSPVAMDRSLVGYAPPADVLKLREDRAADGYVFRRASAGALPDLIRFAASTFSADWGEAIRDAVRRGLPLDRIIVAWRGDRIVGYAMYGAYRGIRERFGPFGVAPDQRGSGLGKILLHESLRAMRAEGLHTAWFLWTDEDSPAGRLYLHAGFRVTRRFHVMRWER